LGVFQCLDAGEMAVDQHGIGQWPQVLGWLELWGMRRQEQQMGAIRFPETAR
jgi:hypothetical protein